MNTHVDKTPENGSQSVANELSQGQSGGESTFQFIDNRPEAIAQRKLQEMVNYSRHGKQAAQLQSKAKSPSNAISQQKTDPEFTKPIQRVAWHNLAHATKALNDSVPAFGGLINPGLTTNISVSGYQFTGPLYTLADQAHTDTKDQAIIAIAAALGNLNLPTSDKFLKKKQLTKNLSNLARSVDNPTETITNKNQLNIYKGALDPFMIRIAGTYGNGEDNRIVIYYQFGVDSYGYITRIEQEGQTYEMNEERGQNALGKAQKGKLQQGIENDPLFNQFSSGHDTANPNESIASKANQSTTGPGASIDNTKRPEIDLSTDLGEDHEYVTGNLPKLKEKSNRLDAIAKLGGEGPRWQCVREHAAHLKNASKFYTSLQEDDSKKIYITFQTLWGQWANLFQSAFNIPNTEVVRVINENKLDNEIIGTALNSTMTDDDFDLDA